MKTGSRNKFLAPVLAATMAGCAPNVMPEIKTINPVVREVVLDCLDHKTSSTQSILTDIRPGQQVFIANHSIESYVHIAAEDGGQFAVWGGIPHSSEPGGMIAASGYPHDKSTVIDVVAGEPEFAGRTPSWYNAGSAITAYCSEIGLQSPTGYFDYAER